MPGSYLQNNKQQTIKQNKKWKAMLQNVKIMFVIEN